MSALSPEHHFFLSLCLSPFFLLDGNLIQISPHLDPTNNLSRNDHLVVIFNVRIIPLPGEENHGF